MSKILVADDDLDIRELLMILLESEGHEVILAKNGQEAIDLMDDSFDLVILDVMMPKLNGIQACTQIRKISYTPILFLTAKGQDNDKVIGFSAGGDDYLVKPFSPSEFISRVKALIRRHLVYQNNIKKEHENSKIVIRGLEIDTDMCKVTINGEVKILTPREYDILLLMAKNKQKVFSAKSIYESIWEEMYYPTSNNTIMVHIRKLREKIEENPQKPEYIKTVWGMGYKVD